MTDQPTLAELLRQAQTAFNEAWVRANDRDTELDWGDFIAARLLAANVRVTGDAGLPSPGESSGFDGETWRCPGCRDTTAVMGMCQRCGIFGLRYEVPVPGAPGLTEASERLIRDWDQHPEAIDANELSARLWLIERQAERRAALANLEEPRG